MAYVTHSITLVVGCTCAQLTDTEQRLKTLQADYAVLQDFCEQLEESKRSLAEKLTLHEQGSERKTEEENKLRTMLSEAREEVARLQEASRRAEEESACGVRETEAALARAEVLLADQEKELKVSQHTHFNHVPCCATYNYNTTVSLPCMQTKTEELSDMIRLSKDTRPSGVTAEATVSSDQPPSCATHPDGCGSPPSTPNTKQTSPVPLASFNAKESCDVSVSPFLSPDVFSGSPGHGAEPTQAGDKVAEEEVHGKVIDTIGNTISHLAIIGVF